MPVLGTLIVIGAAVFMVAALLIVGRLVPAAKRERHNDVVGFVYAVVGVIYAVILAMVVIAAWGSLEDAKTNTYTETNALLQLDWYGHSLPQPQHAEVQGLVKEYTEIVIHDEWPLLARHQASGKAWAVYTQLRDLITGQQPTASADVIRYQQALNAVAQLGDARRERLNEAGDGIPLLLWTALVLGGVVTGGFAFFFGMKSMFSHALIVFCLSLLIGYLLLLVYQMNYPFSGVTRIGPEAFELALQRMQTVS
jgi:Protein of unknown function (DUF4239)